VLGAPVLQRSPKEFEVLKFCEDKPVAGGAGRTGGAEKQRNHALCFGLAQPKEVPYNLFVSEQIF
jgi:hypothetical protein